MAKQNPSFERDYPKLDKMNRGELATRHSQLLRAAAGTHMGLGREEMADESWSEARVHAARVWAPMAADRHEAFMAAGLGLC